MDPAHPGSTLALALFAGVLALAVARALRLPAIVLLFATGALLGPDGLAWVRPAALGNGLLLIVELAVAVILFEGGLNLQLARLRRCSTSIQRLLTVGALIALCGASLAAYLLLGWSAEHSLVFGSLVMVTGPTVIRPLVAELRLRPQLATTLEAEGVLIDPIGAAIAAVALTIATAPQDETMRLAALGFARSLACGIGIGACGGVLLAAVLRARRRVPEGLPNVLTLAGVLLLFQLSEDLSPTSGLLAVTLAGITAGNLVQRDLRELSEFKDQISLLLIGLLFVLLAADVRVSELQRLGWPGLAALSALVLVVRPLSVWCSTVRSELTLRERVFAACIAPRGIVAAAIASVTAVELERAGQPGGAEIRAMVFLTITGTVVLAGITALPLAALLGVRLPERDAIAILGAHPFGLLLGRELRAAARPVLFLDSNPANCRLAEEAGFPTVLGNALEEHTLDQARLGSAAAVIGLTTNDEVNGLFALRSHQLFRVPYGYIALMRLRRGITQEFVEQAQADVLFESGHDVSRWIARVERGSVQIQRWRYAGTPAAASATALRDAEHGERFVILTLRRGDRVLPMSVRQNVRPDDVVTIAIDRSELEDARTALAQYGFREEAEELEKSEPPASPAQTASSA